MENRLVVFGQAPKELVNVADAHVSEGSDAFIVSVVKKSGSSYILSGNMNLTDYAPDAIVKETGIEKGDRTNAVFSLNISEKELDESSIAALNEYIAQWEDLYTYMCKVEEGEIEDTRFDGQYAFEDIFRMSEDGLSVLSVILRAGCGFGYPLLNFDGWAAFEIEFRDDVKNPYHKVFQLTLGEDTEINISSNSGGTPVKRGDATSLVEKYSKTKKTSASRSTGRKEEIPYAEDEKEVKDLAGRRRRRSLR